MINFNKFYFLLAAFFFAIEVFIGGFVHDTIIRPFGGDFLVVILFYCSLKSFINAPVFLSAVCVLAFSYTVEVSQYFHLVFLLGLQNSKAAVMLFGTSFSFTDLLMYTSGTAFIVFTEWVRLIKFKRNEHLLC